MESMGTYLLPYVSLNNKITIYYLYALWQVKANKCTNE